MSTLLEQFDPSPKAIFEPSMVAPHLDHFPEKVLTCYSKKLLEKALEGRVVETICRLDTEDGGLPVYVFEEDGVRYGAYMSRVGAPACVINLEEVISRGAKTVMMFGSCGVLAEDIPKWGIIVPTAALRDEGVSYHYLPASDEVSFGEVTDLVKNTLEAAGETVRLGKVWTTDAIYRETAVKMAKRKEQGCIAVDMESASALAVCQFRGVKFGQFFYTEDVLTEDNWDGRGLSGGVKDQADRLFGLALECLKKL
ncbi:MAG: nucleoside phosphorylase [Firmicutes bacterium]|nr:nucleoside phosphorylase [Bacillota bacterium]